MDRTESDRQSQRIRHGREELVERISKTITKDGSLEAIPGLFLARSSVELESPNSVHRPAFCFIAQGSKHAILGDETFRYDPMNYLIFTVDLPITFQVKEASEERPYLGIRMDLDPALVASVMMESDMRIKKGGANVRAMSASAVDAELLDAVVRLVRLIDSPAEQKIVAPLVIKEIVYRLLASGQGGRLSHLLRSGDTRRISRAIGHLRENFDQPLRIDDIARELGMSVSGFHHHFKSVTAMSPLQFQKQIRLQEARRLMLGEDLDAASAGFRVGYEDPSYFSRDYKKQFGAPPQRDIARLRDSIAV
ncbi:MAG: AraC family transcriptional regulator CmrA [Acidobacteria bacterium]|nr:MAG: AraC family transcriptional regulator CmrA [Acidobacteriota bacterium]